jgi:hypothetical protein
MAFEKGDRVEVLPSANDPSAYDPYCTFGTAADTGARRGLVAGDRGTVESTYSGGMIAAVAFDRIPGLKANVRIAHLRKIESYGNEEE